MQRLFCRTDTIIQNMYTHYKNTSCPSPIYTECNHGDTLFLFFQLMKMSTYLGCWLDLSKILKFNTTRYISLKDFEKSFHLI